MEFTGNLVMVIQLTEEMDRMRWEIIYQLSPLLTLTVYGQPVPLAMLTVLNLQTVVVLRKYVVKSLAILVYQLHEHLREPGTLAHGIVIVLQGNI